MLKGMNHAADRKERQRITQAMIEHEMYRLVTLGFNPITKDTIPDTNIDGEITPETSLGDALQMAFQIYKIADSTKSDIKSMLGEISPAISRCNMRYLMVKDVRRRHILSILRDCEQHATGDTGSRKWSASKFNKYRIYLMGLFKIIIRYEAIEYNPILGIEKEIVTRKVRITLTEEQRKILRRKLSEDPHFGRFIQVFFHSGARITELVQIKPSDVDLSGQRYKAVIRKGKLYKEVWRPIKNIALPYWEKLIEETKPEEYLFGRGLLPGSIPCRRDYITKKWKEVIKDGTGITADLYSLKHLNLTEVSDLLDQESAAKLAGHTSTQMVAAVYDIRAKSRKDEEIRKLANEL